MHATEKFISVDFLIGQNMSKEIVNAWYSKIPKIERDQVLVICEGVAYSPNAVIEEVRKDSAIGMTLQKIIEERRFTDVLDKYSLGVVRLKERLKKLPPEFGIVVEGKRYSPQELLYEIENGTKVGRRFIESEITRTEEILSSTA